eukprot:gene16927-8416_t
MEGSANEDACKLCGVLFKPYEEKISLNRMHGRIQNCLYHKNCFRCTVCHRQLSIQNYFLSSSKHFYCILHCDFESGHNNCSMSRQLKAFKGYSKERLTSLLQNPSPYASPRGHYQPPKQMKRAQEPQLQNELFCFCKSNDIIVPTNSFWIECVTKECKENNCIRHRNIMIIKDFPHKIADQPFELEQYNEEVYEMSFKDTEHHNYYCFDNDLKTVILSLKQEYLKDKEYFRVLVRSSSHIIEGLLPTSCICANKYNESEVVDALRRELRLSDSFKPFLDDKTEEKLCRLDRIMHKSEFKVGLLFIKDGQETEEEFFTNNDHTLDFENFLEFLGEKIQLRGFTGFSGGLDTQFDLTGDKAVFSRWNENEFMFHVSTLLPTDEHDDQKLQRKRHIGNDIVCLVFLSSPRAIFRPSAIKSNFLHVYIVIRPIININNNDKVSQYQVAVISRGLVLPFGPPLPTSGCFNEDEDFKNWLMTKIVNGERASYRSPKFAAMQERTRRQMLDELITEEVSSDHLTMKPKDKANSPLQKFFNQRLQVFPDWFHQTFDDTDQLHKDLISAFNGSISYACDVCFVVGMANQKSLPAVKAILAAKSKVFQEMFYDSGSTRSTPNSSPKLGKKAIFNKSTSSPSVPSGLKKKLSFERLKKRSQSFKNIEEEAATRTSVTECLVTEFEPEEFSVFLEYLHTGTCIIYPEILPSLLCIADHYEVEPLAQSCLRSFEDLIYPNNILQYIERNSEEVFKSFDVAALSEDCLSMVLSLQLKVSEVKKLQVINSWLERNFANGIHKNDFLIKDSLSCLVNIADIELDDLAKEIKDNGLYSRKDLEMEMQRRLGTS